MGKQGKFTLRKYSWTLLIGFLAIGWFYPAIGIIALVCMTAPVIVALITGRRKWCALFCPRGIFNDVILSKISRSRKAPAFLRSVWFKVIFLLFLFYTLFTGLSAADTIAEIGLVFVRLVSVTTAIGIIAGVAFHQRTWCSFCPMGFLAGQMIRLRQWWHDKPRREPAVQLKTSGVVVYTGDHCPACAEVINAIKEQNIAFKEYNIDRVREARECLAGIKKGLVVPTVTINDNVVQAGDTKELQEKLKKLVSAKAG